MAKKLNFSKIPSFGFFLCSATFVFLIFFLFLCFKKPCDFFYAEPNNEYGKDLVKLYESGYAIPESYISSEKRYEEKK